MLQAKDFYAYVVAAQKYSSKCYWNSTSVFWKNCDKFSFTDLHNPETKLLNGGKYRKN